MRFVTIAKDTIVNVEAIASATAEDKGPQGFRLNLVLITGAPKAMTGDSARALWAILQEAAAPTPAA